MTVKDVTETFCRKVSQGADLIPAGEKFRYSGSPSRNEKKSRSHVVYTTLTITSAQIPNRHREQAQ